MAEALEYHPIEDVMPQRYESEAHNDIDAEVCGEAKCTYCGELGLTYHGYRTASGQYIAICECLKCGFAQEF